MIKRPTHPMLVQLGQVLLVLAFIWLIALLFAGCSLEKSLSPLGPSAAPVVDTAPVPLAWELFPHPTTPARHIN